MLVDDDRSGGRSAINGKETVLAPEKRNIQFVAGNHRQPLQDLADVSHLVFVRPPVSGIDRGEHDHGCGFPGRLFNLHRAADLNPGVLTGVPVNLDHFFAKMFGKNPGNSGDGTFSSNNFNNVSKRSTQGLDVYRVKARQPLANVFDENLCHF
ncbi:MAG: hypothetical protein NTY86_22755 [Deltaproteobacteria bacterium]|nr:hypothetical protein [Deltaproteobacteria bacterium]